MPRVDESKYIVFAGWDDVPHLSEAAKRQLLKSTPSWQRDARSKGIPTLGSGAVFEGVNEDDLKEDPFPIPDHWPQIASMDFGWNHPFAATLLAWDRDTDCVHLTREFREQHMTPVRAKVAMHSWEKWLPYAWPHDGHQHEKGTGEELAAQYRKVGFDMLPEHATFPESEGGGYSFEAGITEMLDRMQTGRWKVFRTCPLWFEEFRLYHRVDGVVEKIRDDLLSASRIGMMMLRYGKKRPKGSSKGYAVPKNWRSS